MDDAVLAGHHQRQVAAIGGHRGGRRPPPPGARWPPRGRSGGMIGRGWVAFAQVVEQGRRSARERQAGNAASRRGTRHEVRAGIDLPVVGRRLGHAEHDPPRAAGGPGRHSRAAPRPSATAGLHQAAGELLPDPLGTSASTSPSVTIWRISARFQGHAKVRQSGRRSGQRCRMRTGSSANAGLTWRKPPSARDRAAAVKVSQRVPSASRAMALMVRSRRARSSSRVTAGSVWKTKPA